jgi:mitochondrial fission process protein 1
MSAHRYVAYTSDIGESFRPVAHPYMVRAAYGVSWAYLTGDVAYEGYKAYLRNQRVREPPESKPITSSDKFAPNTSVVKRLGPGVTAGGRDHGTGHLTTPKEADPGHVPAIEDYRAVMAQRAVFQSVASMGLPAFTIHSVVKYSGRAMKDVKNQRIRTWGPIGVSGVYWNSSTAYNTDDR